MRVKRVASEPLFLLFIIKLIYLSENFDYLRGNKIEKYENSTYRIWKDGQDY